MQYSYIIPNVTYVIVTEICVCGLATSGAILQGDMICYNLIFVDP
jgi:energy-converting hydrogenase Eha subunit H